MSEFNAPTGVTVVGVTLAVEQLPWLSREVAQRGGQLILSLQATVALQGGQWVSCPLTEAERNAVRGVTEHDALDAANSTLRVSIAALRTRLNAARRRLRVASEGRLVAICLARGWVPIPSDLRPTYPYPVPEPPARNDGPHPIPAP
jgi:hypothetical protein